MGIEIKKQYVVHCNGDDCDATFDGKGKIKNAREILDQANVNGCHRSKGGNDDLCPKCFAKKQENKPKHRGLEIRYGKGGAE